MPAATMSTHLDSLTQSVSASHRSPWSQPQACSSSRELHGHSDAKNTPNNCRCLVGVPAAGMSKHLEAASTSHRGASRKLARAVGSLVAAPMQTPNIMQVGGRRQASTLRRPPPRTDANTKHNAKGLVGVMAAGTSKHREATSASHCGASRKLARAVGSLMAAPMQTPSIMQGAWSKCRLQRRARTLTAETSKHLEAASASHRGASRKLARAVGSLMAAPMQLTNICRWVVGVPAAETNKHREAASASHRGASRKLARAVGSLMAAPMQTPNVMKGASSDCRWQSKHLEAASTSHRGARRELARAVGSLMAAPMQTPNVMQVGGRSAGGKDEHAP